MVWTGAARKIECGHPGALYQPWTIRAAQAFGGA